MAVLLSATIPISIAGFHFHAMMKLHRPHTLFWLEDMVLKSVNGYYEHGIMGKHFMQHFSS